MRKPSYPLADHPEAIRARSGRPLSELTLEALRAGELAPEDVAIHPETLCKQAEIAEVAGFPHLAANLRRAAELALMPDDKVLALYEALRPYRMTREGLLALADEVEREWSAQETARLIREAAQVYGDRGLYE